MPERIWLSALKRARKAWRMAVSRERTELSISRLPSGQDECQQTPETDGQNQPGRPTAAFPAFLRVHHFLVAHHWIATPVSLSTQCRQTAPGRKVLCGQDGITTD